MQFKVVKNLREMGRRPGSVFQDLFLSQGHLDSEGAL